MDVHESRGLKNLVMKVKREIFSNDVVNDPYSFLPPSAYDTAWLAMIPNPHQVQPDRPLFNGCLDWVLRNQNTGGFWGDQTTCRRPTIDSLTATLASIVALRTWNVGDAAIHNGLAFIHANTKKLLVEQNGCLPRWFIIVFPAMIELAQTKGLDVRFSDCSAPLVEQVFLERQKIFQIRDAVCGRQHYPITTMNASYIEAWPKTCSNYQNAVLIDQSEDGSVFQSPSATAFAFMTTGNTKFLAYLESIVKRCGHGVPPIYPLDEEVIEISLVDWIENLGLTEHFKEEIQNVLSRIFRSYASTEEPENCMGKHVNPQQLYRDSLAFRLLRLHGYTVSPRKFCRFFDQDDKVKYIEEHREVFWSAMYNVYRAADVMFTGETQLEAARAFSKRILENEILKSSEYSVLSASKLLDDDQIKEELRRPWLARLDHLEHRKCIEREEIIGPWSGKAPFYRFPFQRNATLQQLAIENFTVRQSIFRNELKELERWSKGFGLRDLGFAREKTTSCYFAVAATVSLPSLSDVRLAVVKSAILVTVADDFFDAEGSLEELEALTNALHRWEGKDLNGHSKVIFNALEDVVEEISSKFKYMNGYDIIKRYVQDIWHQTFQVWLKEAEWSRNGYTPSIKEYMEVATSSIATQTIVLPASLLLSPAPPLLEALEFPQAETVTHLLMILTRLLNDSQSYQREKEEGKSNLVLLYMKENPNFGLEDSISFIKKMIEEKKKFFLEHVLVNGKSDLPESCKQLYLSCLKAFQMFYNSTNAFDSANELLGDIKRAIYDPLRVDISGEYSLMAPLKSSEGFGLMKEEAELESGLRRNKNESNGRELIGSRSFTVSCALGNWSSQSIQTKLMETKHFKGELPLNIQKPNFYVSFPKIKACVNHPCLC